jgi:hypothetical protein
MTVKYGVWDNKENKNQITSVESFRVFVDAEIEPKELLKFYLAN